MSLLESLIVEFARLPGVGRKTAQRMVYHLLQQPRPRMHALAEALLAVETQVHPCQSCGQPTEGRLCEICADPRRDSTILCVVEEASAVPVVERSGAFKGRYLVLGGRLSPLDGIGPEGLRVKLLQQHLEAGNVREVILATGSSLEGEATATWLQQVVAGYPGVRASRLARGMPVGGDLEYVDGVTLGHALTARESV